MENECLPEWVASVSEIQNYKIEVKTTESGATDKISLAPGNILTI